MAKTKIERRPDWIIGNGIAPDKAIVGFSGTFNGACGLVWISYSAGDDMITIDGEIDIDQLRELLAMMEASKDG
jgi:hypothetical protein